MALPAEQRETLWALVGSPIIWLVHFVISYVTVAVYCAKFAESRQASLGSASWLVGGYTLIALALIAWIGFLGWRRHLYRHPTLEWLDLKAGSIPHDADSPFDRHRFLGLASLLLSSLSFVATLFVAATLVFIGDCN